jgi:hypothetical protein
LVSRLFQFPLGRYFLSVVSPGLNIHRSILLKVWRLKHNLGVRNNIA